MGEAGEPLALRTHACDCGEGLARHLDELLSLLNAVESDLDTPCGPDLALADQGQSRHGRGFSSR
jgi:hypothetical protein